MAGAADHHQSNMRDYRKGNWTIGETMVLIEAKRMDDERRMLMKRTTSSISISIVGGGGGGGGSELGHGSSSSSKPTELRWKWVEDYCWRKGCLRSQNQCNDKWDNLMRDFKKIREYERKLLLLSSNDNNINRSYWSMDKNQRKENNLPTNMLPQIYEALVQVVDRKVVTVTKSCGGSVGGGGGGFLMGTNVQVVSSLPPTLLVPPQQVMAVPIPGVLSVPRPPSPTPPPPTVTQAPPPPPPHVIPCSPTVDSDTSEYSDSPAKRRRKGQGNGGEGASGDGGGDGGGIGHHGAPGAGTSTSMSSHELVGSAISRSASIIAEALQANEEREERRHRDLINLHERRLKIEEIKTEISKQGINGLVDSINKLANSILALASNNNNNTQQSQSTTSPPNK
ncbi:hypothetical protein ACFE04_030296 [Oxalis oulophora]